MPSATVTPAFSSGLEASELETEDDLPDSVVRSFRGNPSWVAGAGPMAVEPLRVLSVMAFAAVTEAAWGSCTRWLEPLRWGRVARVLRGRRAVPPAVVDPSEPGSSHAESVVNVDALRAQYGRASTRPDGSVWRVGRQLVRATPRAQW